MTSSAPLSLLALLLFAASTPLHVHAQFPPLPPIVIPQIGVPPIGSPLPAVIINVAGQLCCTANGTCPGQGLPGVPATLTCLTNSLTSIVAQTVTNDNGTFTLSATLSPAGLINTVSNIILPECVVMLFLSAVNATTCSVLSTTGDVLLSAVQFIEQTVGGVFNGTVSGFVPI